MSGTTSESTNIPTTTTMDTDKVEETQHSLESPVAVTANANTSTTTDNNNKNNANTNAIHVDTVNPAITPLQSAGTSNTIPTEINNHHLPPVTTTATISSPPPRLPYKYDPDKITLRFLFANRDGLTVTVTCNPSDTIGEVKGALISIWPKDVPNCEDGDDLRLICMGKGFLSPDSRTLQDCQIPIFKTHPTPVNVSVKPSPNKPDSTAESSTNHKNNKRNQQQPSNNSTNSTTTNHTNVNNSNNSNSNSNSNTNVRAAITSSSTTNRPSTNQNGPIETGQGCCIIS